jgi:hypothetical protein
MLCLNITSGMQSFKVNKIKNIAIYTTGNSAYLIQNYDGIGLMQCGALSEQINRDGHVRADSFNF